MLWALVTWHKCLQGTIYFSFQFSFNKWSEVYKDKPAWCHINRLICIKYIMEINGIFRTTTQSNLYYEHNNYFGVLNVPEHTHNIWNTFKTSEHVLNTCISFALWKNKKIQLQRAKHILFSHWARRPCMSKVTPRLAGRCQVARDSSITGNSRQ